jgi:hypothetical protein
MLYQSSIITRVLVSGRSPPAFGFVRQMVVSTADRETPDEAGEHLIMATARISRGFRRLSVLIGFLGFLCAVAFVAPDEQHHWDGSPIIVIQPTKKADSPRSVDSRVLTDEDLFVPVGPSAESAAHPLRVRIMTIFLLVAIPVVLTLLFGWVVAGFRRIDSA